MDCITTPCVEQSLTRSHGRASKGMLELAMHPSVGKACNENCGPNSLGILAPVFNEEDGIAEWLDHHLRESTCCFVLIDDGSSDNTTALLRPFAERGLAIVHDAHHKP